MLTDLAYSPDGKAIATGYANGRVEYFDVQLDANGKPSINRRPVILNAHQGTVKSVRFVDAKTLASCGTDGLVRIWNMSTDAAQAVDLTKSTMYNLKLSPDGSRLLYVCRNEFFLVDMDSGKVICRHTRPGADYREPAWSPKGDKTAVCCADSASVEIFDHTGQVLHSISHGKPPEAVAFSPDGSLVAIVSPQQLQFCRSDDGQEIFRQPLNQSENNVAFSHDGSRLACGGRFDAVVIFDVNKRQLLRELAAGRNTTCLTFSPDDSLLATGHFDSVIRLWNVETGQLRAELVGHERSPFDLAFSPDGHTLLSSAADGSIRVWSVENGRGYGVA
jgi:WD40 repeat protein